MRLDRRVLIQQTYLKTIQSNIYVIAKNGTCQLHHALSLSIRVNTCTTSYIYSWSKGKKIHIYVKK